MKQRAVYESEDRTGITVVMLMLCLFVEGPAYSYDTPVKIGPAFLNVDEGPVRGKYSEGRAVHYVMAMNSLTADRVEVDGAAKVEFWAPKIVLRPGFHARPERGYFRAGIPVFYVNCVNLVNSDPANNNNGVVVDPLPAPDTAGVSYQNFFEQGGDNREAFREFCENEIEILNHHFANEYGNQLIRFKLKRSVEWQWDLTVSPPPGLTATDEKLYYCLNAGDSSGTTMGSKTCRDSAALLNASSFADPKALTMIYFRYPNDAGIVSSGTPNKDGAAPFVLINQERSNTALQAPDQGDFRGSGAGNGIRDDDWNRKGVQEHEMGHAFWVQHTWDERVNTGTGSGDNYQATNIMNYGGSSQHSDHSTHSQKSGYDINNNFCNNGLPGNREIGFWVKPFNGDTTGKVCHRWVNSDIDYYDETGVVDNTNTTRGLWSQVEIIYYAAKHHKETWAP